MKNLLVIGGSKGIGNALLKSAVNEYNCTNISRSNPDWTHTNLNSYSLDITSDSLPELGNVDSIVYCPGSITLKPINSLTDQNFIDDFNINVLGAVRVIKKYLKQLKRGESPSVVLFSTVAVNQGMPFHSSIAVAKAGVEALTKSLAAELAPTIRINCIAPSITDTSLSAGILRSDKQRDSLSQKHPLKKILTPEEIAATALFLLSDKSSGITGQVIGVDAGLSTLKI
ncbi:MAG: SDR family oxidoreductase [Saprospiraceae bacterium]|nr:SDR family oxidoreductase [Bacteroidia bacterium]NNE13549.1 SDR family oxidoreductase [Saprospiraceae bacterium]NNL93075.1 SDR family oxidoreductase [Saprospiraceae bacterium]